MSESYTRSPAYKAYNVRIMEGLVTEYNNLMKGYCRVCTHIGTSDCEGCLLEGGELKFSLDPRRIPPKELDGFEL